MTDFIRTTGSPECNCASRDDLAPDFSAKGFVNGEIQSFTLEQFKGRWLLLFFYPSNFTFV